MDEFALSMYRYRIRVSRVLLRKMRIYFESFCSRMTNYLAIREGRGYIKCSHEDAKTRRRNDALKNNQYNGELIL